MADGDISVQVTGLKELADALKQLPTNIGRNVLRGAVNAGATPIQKEAIARAPKDTGRLKKAIYKRRISEKSNDVQTTFYVSVRSGKAQQKKSFKVKGATISSLDAFYAIWIEYGKSGYAPHPFMRPAYATKGQASIEAMKAYLEKRIPLEAEKLGKT